MLTARPDVARRLLSSCLMEVTFNRGTLLLANPPAELHLREVPESQWDSRVGKFRLAARSYPALIAHLAARGVQYADRVRVAGQPERWREIALRPYQEIAVAAWELGGRKGTLVLPTGSGKTRVALAIMARTRRTALCLVPTRVLLQQWEREIATFYQGPVGRYGDGSHERRPITVATFESAHRHMDKLGNHFDLLVVDEAHHFGVRLDESLEMSTAAERLGLTATPPTLPSTRARLALLLGPIVCEYAISNLVGRFLAPFEQLTLEVGLNEEERGRYRVNETIYGEFRARMRREQRSATWAEFVQVAARSDEGRRALAAFRQLRKLVTFPEAKRRILRALLARHRDARMLLFTADNHTAYTIAREQLIMPITCDIGRAERADALRRFSSGELRALVSARVLNEGIDVPEADVAIIIGGSFGEREHVQRVGRLLRPRDGKRALIYQLVARDTFEVHQAHKRSHGLTTRRAPSI